MEEPETPEAWPVAVDLTVQDPVAPTDVESLQVVPYEVWRKGENEAVPGMDRLVLRVRAIDLAVHASAPRGHVTHAGILMG